VSEYFPEHRRVFDAGNDANITLTVLEQLGAVPGEIIRTRMMLTRIEDWEAVKGIGPFFGPLLKGQREPKHYQDDYGDNNPRD
jgi:hypothetical protein